MIKQNKKQIVGLLILLVVMAGIYWLVRVTSGVRIAEIIFCVGVLVSGVIYALFVWRSAKPSGYDAVERHVEELKKEGLIEELTYDISRVLRLEEGACEGPHYYLELCDGRVLCLTGQYLYQEDMSIGVVLNPIPVLLADNLTVKDKAAELYLFPCTRFTLFRHKIQGYVIDLVCNGESLLPEWSLVYHPYCAADADGDYIPLSLEEIAQRCGAE